MELRAHTSSIHANLEGPLEKMSAHFVWPKVEVHYADRRYISNAYVGVDDDAPGGLTDFGYYPVEIGAYSSGRVLG